MIARIMACLNELINVGQVIACKCNIERAKRVVHEAGIDLSRVVFVAFPDDLSSFDHGPKAWVEQARHAAPRLSWSRGSRWSGGLR